MEVKLEILHGRLKSGTGAPRVEGFTIRQPRFVVGSHADCNMVCRSRLVSEQHCEISLGEHDATLVDLGSDHGTYLNGVSVEGRATLKTGDLLKVGRLQFTVTVTHATKATPLPPPLPDEPDGPSDQPPPVARDTVAMAAPCTDTIFDETGSVDDLVSEMLSEADEEDRQQRLHDPSARYLRVETQQASAKPASDAESDEAEPAKSDDPPAKRGRPPRQRPGKLPVDKLPGPKGITADGSVDAAELALEELLRSAKGKD